jgi:DNA-binding LytR/AlgR family response regulator
VDHVSALVAQLQRIIAADAPSCLREPLSVLRVSVGQAVRMMVLAEICYFRAADRYTVVVTAEGEALMRMSFKELLARLPPEHFRQIHRGTIVNMDEVTAAVCDDFGRLSLRLRRRAESLVVSRVFADLFKA